MSERAMLSDREQRGDVEVFDALPRPPWAESRWSPLHPGIGTQCDDVWDWAAQLEARRILAETEPGPGGYACYAQDRRPSVLQHQYHAALAEALAAFCALESLQ